jgi:Acetyltransferase (GNAT) domain
MTGSSSTPSVAEPGPPPALRDRYDDFVGRSPQGSIFATSWWLDAVAPGGWRLHDVQKGDDLVAAWPTVVRRSRWGEVHGGAPLTPFLGPLLSPGEGARRRSREIEAVESLLERIGAFAHLEARCHPAFDYWTPLAWYGFAQTTRYTWRLPDLGDVEATFKGFRENVRGHIRSAEKHGLAVEEAALDAFLALHEQRAATQEDWSATDRRTVERIDSACGWRGARSVLVARDPDGRVRAGAYVVYDGRFAYYLMSATDGEVRGSAALVVWESVKRAAERGLGFDFEGSMLPHVEPFVRGFGGVPIPYSVVRKTASSGFRAERTVKRAALAAAARVKRR